VPHAWRNLSSSPGRLLAIFWDRRSSRSPQVA
jgi:hypothetical protein